MGKLSGRVAVVTGASECIGAALAERLGKEGTANMKNFDQFRDMMIPRTPLGRVGKPGDIASVVAFLVSDDAAWITGQMIQAAGGLSL